MKTTSGWNLVSGIGGVAFGVLLLAGGFAPGPPPSVNAQAKDIVAFYTQHGGAQQVGNFLIGLAVTSFFLFLPGLWSLIRRLEGEGGSVALAAVGAGVSAAAVGLVGTAAFQALAVGAGSVQDPNIVSLLEIFARTARNASYFPQAVLIGLTSWLLLGSRGATRPIGIAGLIVALLLLISVSLVTISRTFSVQLVDLLALLGFGGWYIAMGMTLTIRALRGSPAVEAR